MTYYVVNRHDGSRFPAHVQSSNCTNAIMEPAAIVAEFPTESEAEAYAEENINRVEETLQWDYERQFAD
jgi:hypothetical protein